MTLITNFIAQDKETIILCADSQMTKTNLEKSYNYPKLFVGINYAIGMEGWLYSGNSNFDYYELIKNYVIQNKSQTFDELKINLFPSIQKKIFDDISTTEGLSHINLTISGCYENELFSKYVHFEIGKSEWEILDCIENDTHLIRLNSDFDINTTNIRSELYMIRTQISNFWTSQRTKAKELKDCSINEIENILIYLYKQIHKLNRGFYNSVGGNLNYCIITKESLKDKIVTIPEI